MRHKRVQLSAVFIFGLGLTGLQAQTMSVKQINGNQTAYSLNNVWKMTFSGGNLNVRKTDNSTGVFTLSGLKTLNFTLLSTVDKQTMQVKNSHLLTYPNPVADILNLDLSGEEGEGILKILMLNGKVMLTQNASNKSLETINLSHLPQGIYLCQYVNNIGVKTIKIIKQ